jgi:hypothetical protein
MKSLLLLATVFTLMLPASGSADRAKGYQSCGEVFTYNGSKVLKVQKLTCRTAREVAHDYERKAFAGSDPETGDVEEVRRFECTWNEYFDEGKLAYKCRHTRQQGKAFKALHPGQVEGG